MLVHATAVAIGGHGVLITGASGRGKSDLALRLIDRGAVLIADDQVRLDADLRAFPPPVLAGLLEVRGVGIVRLPFLDGVVIRLIADLDAPPERLPEPTFRALYAVPVPLLAVAAFEASAAIKVERALMPFASAVELAP